MLETEVTCADGDRVVIRIADDDAFERLRSALDDPLWLLGATHELLETNEYKRGRFIDALGAWAGRLGSGEVAQRLDRAQVVSST